MNIVHIAPNGVFSDGWTYQENLLTKYQMKLGHTVTLITQNHAWVDGKDTEVPCSDEVSRDGFRVIRLERKALIGGPFKSFVPYLDVYQLLVELKPDMIFYHGMVNATICQAARYKKKVNKNLVLVQDNHLDYNIGKLEPGLKGKMSYLRNRLYYRMTGSYVDRVYGVTPWRKKYAIEVYGVPESKADVLIMGADDEKIDFAHRAQIRESIRKQYGIPDDSFLIVTGGKLDKNKNIPALMEAVRDYPEITLLIFGNVLDDIRETFDRLLAENPRIQSIGWIPGDKIYDYFFAADLVCFPGQHSVLWEQACAAKVPCLFKKWEGMEHVDNGGNSAFVDLSQEGSLSRALKELLFTDKYAGMKKAAESDKTDVYLYSHIAEKSLELLEQRSRR